MRFSQSPRAFRAILGTAMAGILISTVGCGGESAPVSTPVDIEKREKDEAAARQKAFGKTGNPSGKKSGKAAKAS